MICQRLVLLVQYLFSQSLDRSRRYGAILVVGVWMTGCSSSIPAVSSTEQAVSPPSPEQTMQALTLGQSLPISAQVKLANQILQLEVAKTPEQQSLGLMYRQQLDDNRGMLFPFQPARQVGFWMKNVAINLDMVFLKNGKVVAIASNVPPCTEDPCPIYGPKELVDQVIELRGGRAQELNIKPGDKLVIQPL